MSMENKARGKYSNKIKVGTKNGLPTVTFNGVEECGFRMFNRNKWEKHHEVVRKFFVKYDQNIPRQPKKMCKYLQENYGSKVWVRWNKIMYKEWVVPLLPVKNTLLKSNFGGKYICGKTMKTLYKNKDLLHELQDDGLDNLFELSLSLGKRPNELKKFLGKGLWKRICSNTRTRNALIAKNLKNHSDPKTLIEYVNNTPSTLLKKGIVLPNINGIDEWAKDIRYKNINKWDVERVRGVVTDCTMMAKQLREPFNHKWSLKRIHKEHERFRGMINAKKYSKDIFNLYEDSETFIREVEHKGYTAELIMTPYDLKMEGESMRHCIGSYYQQVSAGNYAMYSLKKGGVRKSSLQVVLTGITPSLGQHYGFGNSLVEDNDLKGLANKVLMHYRKVLPND